MLNLFGSRFVTLMFALWLLPALTGFGQSSEPLVVTSDIDNFWAAYDRITATKDGTAQYEYLNKLFIEKASPGQRAMMELKKYTPKSYIEAITRYPLFWNSIRANTLKAKSLAGDLKSDISKLKSFYPELKPAVIYFTVGTLDSGGTIKDGMVLIGSEIALGDSSTMISELPKGYDHLKPFFQRNSLDNVVFTNIHEYVHTQQKTTDGDTLLAQSVLEGVAEFVAVKATGKPSILPAVTYGRLNNSRIRAQFAAQMFNPFTGFWLYSNAANDFNNTRDLGYYVGYAICEKYYAKSKNKMRAVSEMIKLAYNGAAQLNAFVEQSGYFDKKQKNLSAAYERGQPYVIGIKPFSNGAANVNPKTTQLVIEFSAPMDKNYRSFDIGTLGTSNLLKLKRFVSLSEDGKTLILEVELKPNARQQLVVAAGFRSVSGISLKPFQIDITTAGN